ncbi:MAG: metallopeptidase TldD-related protein [Bryobacteraceae bacterium]
MRAFKAVALLPLLAAGLASAAETEDVVLKAMRDELARARGIKLETLDSPYYIEYAIDEGDTFSAAASLGGLVSFNRDRFRQPNVQVRVGDYDFDNTNYIASGFPFGSRYRLGRFPVEDSYNVMRRHLWLATDQGYKAALQAIARKRSALQNVAGAEQLPDFSHADPVRLLLPYQPAPFQEEAWKSLVRSLSGIFKKYPEVMHSTVDLQAFQGLRYLVNSEGSEVRDTGSLIFVRVRANTQASDGMLLRSAHVVHARHFGGLPSEQELAAGIAGVAESLTALKNAPVGEDYNGPILFEGEAAAQLFAQVLGRNLATLRKPVMEPGRSSPFPSGELEGRMGARILPEWIDVVDDPTQKEWRGKELIGHYAIDMEAVVPKPVVVVEKGVLKNFLHTRRPSRGRAASNGRARLPGPFGARTAAISNLFVRASETLTPDKLKAQLMELCKLRDKPYGLIVRKMDFPSSASVDEVRRVISSQSGSANPVSAPILVSRVYPDGREELIRGVRFKGLTARSLKDILAASNESHSFEYLDSGAPFALMGAGSTLADSVVIAPSVLIDDLEIQKIDDDFPRPPLVPAP